ncbi:hypothetical protein [Paenibacillus periandrae]|uniref:hypothetical protein n=1 Tax=Paenibacillus periandrae TaxID=1761741 RepID=UPI001F099887|nr:hypothetical protein [Paenibacillus periandrae]
MVDALTAVDVALWDILGKSVQLPVYQLLSGAYRREIPAYVSGIPKQTREERIELALEWKAKGFTAIKLHLGFGVHEDAESGMNGLYFYEELNRGAVGTMPACEFPEVCVRIYQAFKSGDLDTARQTFYQYLPFMRIGTLPGFAMAVHKEILRTGGVIESAYVRNPNAPIDERIRQEALDTLKDVDLLALRWHEVKAAR